MVIRRGAKVRKEATGAATEADIQTEDPSKTRQEIKMWPSHKLPEVNSNDTATRRTIPETHLCTEEAETTTEVDEVGTTGKIGAEEAMATGTTMVRMTGGATATPIKVTGTKMIGEATATATKVTETRTIGPTTIPLVETGRIVAVTIRHRTLWSMQAQRLV
jgi:hypothetical protein